MKWAKCRRCPACGGKPDSYTYEADEEQQELGYPAEFRFCGTCACPMLVQIEGPYAHVYRAGFERSKPWKTTST